MYLVGSHFWILLSYYMFKILFRLDWTIDNMEKCLEYIDVFNQYIQVSETNDIIQAFKKHDLIIKISSFY